tara:strand:+ start:448 stop:549 length:102 start_codon:yes stop_codon:yes gene_type:complete
VAVSIEGMAVENFAVTPCGAWNDEIGGNGGGAV